MLKIEKNCFLVKNIFFIAVNTSGHIFDIYRRSIFNICTLSQIKLRIRNTL